MAGNCLNSTFSNKLLIHSCCNYSKSGNHISDRVFECLSGILMCNSDFLSLLTSENMLRSSALPLYSKLQKSKLFFDYAGGLSFLRNLAVSKSSEIDLNAQEQLFRDM